MSVPIELKIENWGNIVIQHLYNLAKSEEYCDYTIHSTLADSFKVHRIVLNACSEYFRSCPYTDSSITIPAHLDFNAVKSVIMFMYTGKLHYTKESHISLLEVAITFNVTSLFKLLEIQGEVNKSTSNNFSPLAVTSSICSEALNQCKSFKESVSCDLYSRSLSKLVSGSNVINSMKVKDVLTENRPMQFEHDVYSLPNFIENPFELPKYDSAPLLILENIDSKVMLKRTFDGKLIDKNHKTPLINCGTQTLSLTDKKQKNLKKNLVQEVLIKIPHLSQSKDNIELKMANTNQSQFGNIIINPPDSINDNMSLIRSDIKNPLSYRPQVLKSYSYRYCSICFKIFKTFEQLSEHLSDFHKISEETTKKRLLCAMDSIQITTKVFIENKSMDKIEKEILNNEDFLKQKDFQKDLITFGEEATEIENVTLEDALQAINELSYI